MTRLLVSFVILAGAAFWTYKIGLQANLYDHKLYDLQPDVEEMRKTVATMEAQAKLPKPSPSGVKKISPSPEKSN